MKDLEMTKTQLAPGKSGSWKLTILGTLRVDLTSSTIGSGAQIIILLGSSSLLFFFL